MHEVEDLFKSPDKIKYCNPRVWPGIIPGKHETKAGQNQILIGGVLKQTDFKGLTPTRSDLFSRKPMGMQGEMGKFFNDQPHKYRNEIDSFYYFLIGLKVFRESIALGRKGGKTRKFLFLAYLWLIEYEKGYFTKSDLIAFARLKKVDYYFAYFLKGELITEHRPRKRKNAHSFFLLSAKVKSRLLRSWVQALGARYRKPDIYVPGEVIATMRKECQMSLNEFALEIGITAQHLYKIELGHFGTSDETNARLIDRFYYLLPSTYWPQSLRDEVNEGKRPRYGNAEHWQRLGKKSHYTLLKNAYSELKDKLK